MEIDERLKPIPIIKKLSMEETINHLCQEAVKIAEQGGMTTNIEVHVSPFIFESLDMSKIEFPPIADETIKDRQQDDGTYLSDIYVYDPEWLETE